MYVSSFCFNTLTLSVSMAVLAISIRAFSSLLGWLTPTFFSSRKPGVSGGEREKWREGGRGEEREREGGRVGG